MAPVHKLTYFSVTGAAEPIRFLFKYGNIDFEDIRVKHADWPKLKENAPFGQIPFLEYNGKKINQSHAIARYAAKLAKLTGKDDWEDLEIDAAVDTINDLKQKFYGAMFYEQDETRKKALAETVINETAPYYLSRLDAQVQKNKGYLVGGHLTWADLSFASSIPGLDVMLGKDLVSNYPNLTALKEKVLALPAIKKWVAERPADEM